MEGYVGRSITEPMLDYGQPAAVFDLPDGRRAFQWSISSWGSVPIVSTDSRTSDGIHDWADVTRTRTIHIPVEETCLYTLYGVPRGNDWIVTGYRQPSFECA
ncbi:hypothetical protein KUV51_04435 [Tateyamaria omphalii]|uniref:hypothetical protein n=1 Tax=Tateyamaria omphalii TaxID=299262 RepID=UPI001C99BE31|nr:hypothetical protein [Tateyamaria omphalii]MBY5932238.1 hypothetical protein [Tateyamaria omphalii]